MTKHSSLYKPCSSCGGEVHMQSKACKKCGAASPWSGRTDTAVKTLDLPEVTGSEFKPHIVLRNFEQMVGDVMVRLKADQIISDFNLIKRLLIAHAPIAEIGAEKEVCVCPNCKHVFATGKNGSTSA